MIEIGTINPFFATVQMMAIRHEATREEQEEGRARTVLSPQEIRVPSILHPSVSQWKEALFLIDAAVPQGMFRDEILSHNDDDHGARGLGPSTPSFCRVKVRTD
jgi:hypothetical protein